MAEAEVDFGATNLTLKQLQRFRGIMTGCTSALRGLNNELKAVDKFLDHGEREPGRTCAGCSRYVDG